MVFIIANGLCLGSVSIEAGHFMDNYSADAKQIWVTLFDHQDDDMYDGDFTYDDAEIPRILIEFREASSRTSKTSHRVTTSAAKTTQKKEVIGKTTRTTVTTITSTSRVGSEATVVRTQQTERKYKNAYTPKAIFEIGEEPANSSGFNARNLEGEIREQHNNVILDLKDLQQTQFSDIDSRVEALGFLERAHQELKGEHAQDTVETDRLRKLARDVDAEISTRKTRIDSEVEGLRQDNQHVAGAVKDTEDAVRQTTQANRKLQDRLDVPEDLTEQGFSQQAKDVRTENAALKKAFGDHTGTLLAERDARNVLLAAHGEKVREYNDTVFKYYGLLLKAEEARKIHLDGLNDVEHQVNKYNQSIDQLDKRAQITEIDIESLSELVESLRRDLASNDKVYSEHISELSSSIVDQNREIGHLKDDFNLMGANIRELQTEIEKQKVHLKAHEEEMDAIKSIEYDRKIGKCHEDLRKAEEIRRKHQDELENAQEGLSAKMTLFADQAAERKRERDQMMARVAGNLDKLNAVQGDINDILRDLDALNSKKISDTNKDTVGVSLDNEKESLTLKLRWANDEKDRTMRDLNEAIKLARAKEEEIREQERQIRELKKEIAELRALIEEKKKIIAELERQIQILNEKIEIVRQKIADLDAKIAELRLMLSDRERRLRDLTELLGSAPPPPPVDVNYRAVRGDEVDEMLANYLQNCPVPVKRLGGGFYLFGTRKIYAKIMNGKLVVRVGGGYMFISEFITTYSEPEIIKLTKICENLGVESIWDLDLEELYNNKSGGGAASPGRSPGGFSPNRSGKGASLKKSIKSNTAGSPINGTTRQKAFNASALVRKL